jgi:hypothetical protein
MLVALVGGGPWSVAKALAADAVPAHLCRSTYVLYRRRPITAS